MRGRTESAHPSQITLYPPCANPWPPYAGSIFTLELGRIGSVPFHVLAQEVRPLGWVALFILSPPAYLLLEALGEAGVNWLGRTFRRGRKS